MQKYCWTSNSHIKIFCKPLVVFFFFLMIPSLFSSRHYQTLFGDLAAIIWSPSCSSSALLFDLWFGLWTCRGFNGRDTHSLIPIIYLLLHREADKRGRRRRRRRKRRGKRLKMRTKSRPLIIKSHQWWEVGGQCEGEIEVGRGVRVCVCVCL